jgi:hypothetical protein
MQEQCDDYMKIRREFANVAGNLAPFQKTATDDNVFLVQSPK